MKISLELLYHYQCDACQKWWSVSDIPPVPGKRVQCIHCGHEDIVPRRRDVLLGSDFQSVPDLKIKQVSRSWVEDLISRGKVNNKFGYPISSVEEYDAEYGTKTDAS